VDWNVSPSGQREPHHFVIVYARLHTGLAWIIGIALPRLLPPDL
jgi:hypothetical protein